MVKLLRKASLAGLLLLLLTGCGVGDDNGERLGEYIIGTWQRGWGPGDVIIEGAPEPEDPDEDEEVSIPNRKVRNNEEGTMDYDFYGFNP